MNQVIQTHTNYTRPCWDSRKWFDLQQSDTCGPVWSASIQKALQLRDLWNIWMYAAFGLQPLLWVTCTSANIFLIKYERLNGQTLIKPTVSIRTAGTFIVGLEVQKDANKERDQREDVIWAPTRFHDPYCCSASGFHLLLRFFLNSTHPPFCHMNLFNLGTKMSRDKALEFI